ncbi:MAG: Uma2 family endonuclease [Planctomycetaceae bacterium]|nr:Uma2 family endonuclease [Planctomycetaceae bacterium]
MSPSTLDAIRSQKVDTGDGDPIPPLQNGDRLQLAEFLRRYEAMPNVNKAELVEGIVSMPSPVRVDHGFPHSQLITWVGNYHAFTPGVEPIDNVTTLLDDDNGPQPDAALRILPECGGQTRTEDGYVIGAPEFLGEVAVSTVSRDLHDKFRAYQKTGVREYLVWRVWDREIDWFSLRDGRYERQTSDADGILRSTIFPGLWLDVPALIAGNMAQVLQTLNAGLATPEHAAFVEELARRRSHG